MQSTKGATLIELLVVVAILGITSAWVIAKVPSSERRIAANDELQRARSRAIRSRQSTTVWIAVNDTMRAFTAGWDGSVRASSPAFAIRNSDGGALRDAK